MATVDATGSLALTVGAAAATMDDLSAPGTYVWVLDLSTMAAGDVIIARISAVHITAGGLKGVERVVWGGAQDTDDVLKYLWPLPVAVSDNPAARLTLQQPRGTNRTIPWATWKIA